MTKNYFYNYFLIGVFALMTSLSVAQVSSGAVSSNKATVVKTIEGLSIYPNPVQTNGKITIETKTNETKEVEIYNVMGKKILATQLNTKELVLPSSVTAGIYIIKIKENNASATRKLIVK
ncbi:T9SS type A sorting domain-containing protein [Myroides sp. 1354]|uniref:T9SS type A sorting domain-containing protein n=1 Tax=unclassified Myroides TaxID=2642485 RepID=UPI002575D925|nr:MULTISPECIES: T9SS type A sorting domain-containing protein [unclassified Myroides]MDM1044088.1 T9SS type A sorting domain-containing protein [Myroides sp. R163-1]MDM1055023.1 T9SS type A sorting domain-containing protein [Myroides sp. 1354]MDM1068320.1 T9SS type A sorting domain-containing protein [Myroides sp. 1372]